MRVALLLLLPLSLSAFAENTLTDRDRQILSQQQRVREAQLQRARARCIEQRGVTCDTADGLREWMLLDRTREEAVLDQVRPGPAIGAEPMPSSGSGATTPAPGR